MTSPKRRPTIRAMLCATTMAAAASLAACAPQTNSKRAPLDRPLSENYLQIVSASDELVEIDSGGRIVRAAAPEGLCISADSVQTGPDAVFLIMGDCLYNQGPSVDADENEDFGELGGVLSISVSNGPLGSDFATLERFFASGEGLAGLGHGGDAKDVSLIETRRENGALIALVEDRSAAGPAFAGDVICRAFMELNGRMTVVSLIGLRDDPRSVEMLRDQIGKIVRALRAENT